jgi:hypothetical protein
MCKKLIYLISFVLLLGLVGNAAGGDKASNPSPADGTICADSNVVLSWSPACLAIDHHVYFGTTPNALALVATKPLGQESYSPGPLELGTKYYWRIDEVGPGGVVQGEVWSFTVGYPFSGLLHTPLGQAQLSPDANGNLVVDNIGSSGEDGVAIELPDDIREFHANWIDLGDPNASEGAILEMVTRGIINGKEQVIAIIHREHIMGQVRMDVNFPVLEPEYVEARYYYKGELVLTEENEHGSTFGDWWDSWEVNDGGVKVSFWPPGIEAEITFCKTGGAAITTPNGNVVAQVDKISITPKDYTGAFDRFTSWSITAAGIPSITLTEEVIKPLGFDLDHKGLGKAQLSVDSKMLVVSNIGSSGEDGVSVDLPEGLSSWDFDILELGDANDPLNPIPDGAFMITVAKGRVEGIADQAIGQISVEDIGQTLEISADYTPIGSSSYTIEVYDGGAEGVLVARKTGHTGSIATCIRWPFDGKLLKHDPNTGFGITIGITWRGFRNSIAIVGGPTVQGDYLKIVPESPTVSAESVSSVEIKAKDIPSFSITNEAVHVWSFTEANYVVVDDFESYTDSADLKATWQEGSITSLISLETTTVHDGSQAMKFEYDNSLSPYYSEAVYTYDIPQDWTANGIKALELWFRVGTGNDANQMYVAVEDTTGSSGIMVYNPTGHPCDGCIRPPCCFTPEGCDDLLWLPSVIRVADFADGGVDLTDVSKVYIGFGDRDNPVPGGSGSVYIDDIGLCPGRCSANPVGDLNGDCVNNFKDLAIMAGGWLDTGIWP